MHTFHTKIELHMNANLLTFSENCNFCQQVSASRHAEGPHANTHGRKTVQM